MASLDKQEKRKSSQPKEWLPVVVVTLLSVIIFFSWLYFTRQSWLNRVPDDDDILVQIKDVFSEPMPEFDFFELGNEPEIKEDNPIDEQLQSDANSLIENLKEQVNKKTEPREEEQELDCPAWINCMPRVGESVDCEIPLGCEGITEKVY